jgi:hypothetical protein
MGPPLSALCLPAADFSRPQMDILRCCDRFMCPFQASSPLTPKFRAGKFCPKPLGGDMARFVSVLFAALIVFLEGILPASAASDAQRAYDACTPIFNDNEVGYRRTPGPKAMVAGLSDDGFSTDCDTSYDEKNVQLAIKQAMNACRVNMQKCFLYHDSSRGLSDWAARISNMGGNDGTRQTRVRTPGASTCDQYTNLWNFERCANDLATWECRGSKSESQMNSCFVREYRRVYQSDGRQRYFPQHRIDEYGDQVCTYFGRQVVCLGEFGGDQEYCVRDDATSVSWFKGSPPSGRFIRRDSNCAVGTCPCGFQKAGN